MYHVHETLHPKTFFLDKDEMFKNEDSDEVHGFLLTHRVNGRPEGVQRTHTHDDVHTTPVYGHQSVSCNNETPQFKTVVLGSPVRLGLSH